MQKIFALLLAEFRKLGATIVFANFSKIIINTEKYDLSIAKAYCDSLLRTIQSRSVVHTNNFFFLSLCKILSIFGIVQPKMTKVENFCPTSFKNEQFMIFN